VRRALDEVGLAPGRFLERYPHQLSGGQRRRVAIAATLVLEPDGLSLAWQLCDRIAVMCLGRVVEQGDSRDVIERPGHPYTQALVEAVPPRKQRRALGGELPTRERCRPAAASTRAARSASSPATARTRRSSRPRSPATRRPARCSATAPSA
jgi:peptide/nickel transport system ATP-binding protein